MNVYIWEAAGEGTASTITPHLDHPPSGYSGRMSERTLSSVAISLAVKSACSPRPVGCRDLPKPKRFDVPRPHPRRPLPSPCRSDSRSSTNSFSLELYVLESQICMDSV